MPRKSDEDLFRESTMTFGEHLEELRMCLFKALFGLIIGFLVGLGAAKYVVRFIQGPLEDALEEHYKKAAIADIEEQLGKLQDEGLPLPGSPKQLAELVMTQDLLPEQVLIQPSEVLEQLTRIYRRQRDQRGLLQNSPSLLRDLTLPENDPSRERAEQKREELAAAIKLLRPMKLPGGDSAGELSQDDLDDIAKAIRNRRAVGEDRQALISKAVALQKKRLQEDLARLDEGLDLLHRTELPQKEPHEKLVGDDLAQIFIWRPVESDRRISTQTLNAHEAFAIFVKAALLFGAMLASPWVFYQIWLFVAAGLYHHERRFVHVFLPLSVGLFFAGASLAFFFVFKPVLRFLFYFNDMLNIDPNPRISEWLGFVLILPLGFGIAFQLPLVMLFLERIGVFTIQSYLSKWRIAVLVIFVLAMFLTPADPWSMLLMAVPLTFLYFGGVLLCRLMPRRRSPYDDQDADSGH